MHFWTTSDIAICINAKAVVRNVAKPPLKEGKPYPVKGVSLRPCCSRMLLDVGITTPSEKKFDICVCGAVLDIRDRVWWFYADRFKPQDEAVEKNKESLVANHSI